MVEFIRRVFLEFFILTDLIANLLEGIYKIYLIHRDKYKKYGTIISVIILFILFFAYQINAKKLMTISAIIIGLIIFIPYYIGRINLCRNSILYFLYTILIVLALVCLIISSYIVKIGYFSKLPLLIYLIMCIFFSMISKKDVALIGNEIIGTIATFIYTLIMHYKDNISEYVKGLFLNTPVRLELTAKDIQEIEAFDNYITQATSVFLIIIFISVISIMLIHLKDYCNEKYLRHIIEEYNEDKCV